MYSENNYFNNKSAGKDKRYLAIPKKELISRKKNSPKYKHSKFCFPSELFGVHSDFTMQQSGQEKTEDDTFCPKGERSYMRLFLEQ